MEYREVVSGKVQVVLARCERKSSVRLRVGEGPEMELETDDLDSVIEALQSVSQQLSQLRRDVIMDAIRASVLKG